MVGCATGPGRAPGTPTKQDQAGLLSGGQQSGSPKAAATTPAPDPELDHGLAAVPVFPEDPTWGDPDAPVTLVVWSDFQCPFCARVVPTIEELKKEYGPKQLRIAWKNFPLPFHANAHKAAEAAMAVHGLGGAEAFWRFHDLVFANQRALSPESYLDWAARAGVDARRVQADLSTGKAVARVDADIALGTRLAVRGTPVFHVNGVQVAGAQPIEVFKGIMDAQLAAARELVARGTPARRIYPLLAARNFQAPAAVKAPEPEPTEDTTVWSVPVQTDDPVRGPADALVTVVVFSDFQCPFCKRVEGTLAALAQKFGSDLRIVWKDYPLPFHDRAIPAAVFARVALDHQGVEGFWRAHDALFAAQEDLGEAALARLAGKLGLSWSEIQKASADRRYLPTLDLGQDLAKKLDVRGTPCFFINGRRLEGAMPLPVFMALVDGELAKAREKVAAGQSRQSLYAAITNTTAKPASLEGKRVVAPSKENPSRGDGKAKVTIQVFADFQCPYSRKVMPTLAQIEKKHAGQVRLVWRNYPLPFHEDAAVAAEAAQEVFAQKGASAFWKYGEMLFGAQSEVDGLGRENLEKLAHRLGVNAKKFRVALDDHRHRATIERDVQAAKDADIDGMPAVLVNGYLVGGAESAEVFESAVERVLRD